MKRGRLSPDEIRRLEELAAKRYSRGRIAQLMDRHPSTIEHAMVRHGLHSPRELRQKPYVRKGIEVRPFTAEEDFYCETLRVAGHSYSAIARAMTARFGHRRSPNTISMRLVQLAAREGDAG